MRNIQLIAFREFWTRVRKRTFLIATFGLPILMMLLIVGIVYIAILSKENALIAIKDDTGWFEDKFRGLDQGENLRFVYFHDTTQRINIFVENNKAKYDGILFIPKIEDIHHPIGIRYYADKAMGMQMEYSLQDALQYVIQNKMLAEKGLDEQWLETYEQKISIESVIGDNSAKGIGAVAGIIGNIMGMLIYLYLLIYGTMVMKSISEEKTNRVVEVMLSCTRPFDMMMGKIIGIGFVGFTQFILWMAVLFFGQLLLGIIFADKLMMLQDMSTLGLQQQGMQDSAKIIETIQALDTLNVPMLIIGFLVYFIGGYLFYGAQFAAVGAAITDDGESQQFMIPIIIPIIMAFVFTSIAIEQPGSAAAWWGSMLPFTSPIVMMARLPYGIPIFELLISIGILFSSGILMVFLSARIYRIGILIQGKKVTFSELGKWMWKG